MLPAVSSVLVAHFTVGLWPSATPTRTCASGPTCIGLPLKRGALTHEYLPLSSNFVYFGSVSSSNGCFDQSPSYQACEIDSVTFSRNNGSLKVLISCTLFRSAFMITPPGKSNCVPLPSSGRSGTDR